jgi:S-adenosylmethionine:tRNA ribosyltransferase-isomerase
MIPEISIEDFNYTLPEKFIPSFPTQERDESKLLIYRKGEITQKIFKSIHNELDEPTLLVFNNTKVFPARLFFTKKTGASIEIFCLNPVSQPIFENGTWKMDWQCFIGNVKKWKNNEILILETNKLVFSANLIEKRDEAFIVQFSWNQDITFFDVLENCAEIPLPPYMNRRANKEDNNRYQTVYASEKGSVAAPTAGLHFTEGILNELTKKNIQKQYLTLHVGAGTFRPVKTKTVNEHEMHTEQFNVSSELVTSLLTNKQIIPVGTTSLRVLESLYWIGLQIFKNPMIEKIEINQWEPYINEAEISTEQALDSILSYLKVRNLTHLSGLTQILIMPSYQFKVIHGLITNFHQPKSTLLLLIAALIGNDWKKVYQYALSHDFKFLSYGDSSLLIP